MRRLLYSLIFVTVLLLAGYAALAGENEPSGGGTVPDGEHQVWLPVVAGREPTLGELYPNCPHLAHPVLPLDGAVVSGSEPLTVTFSYERGISEYDTGLLGWSIMFSPDYGVGKHAIGDSLLTVTIFASQLPPPGSYAWYVQAYCWHPNIYPPYPTPRSITRTITIQPTGQ